MAEITKPPSVLDVELNGDGQFTLSDAGLWIGEAFFLPGDWLIWAVATYAPPVAEFFEISAGDYGGVLSGFVSALAWAGLVLGVGVLFGAVRDFDRALTSRIGRFVAETRRRLRVGWALLTYRLRRGRREPSKRDGVELSEEIELSSLELRVLRLHAELRAGYALAVSEVATALGLRRNQALDTLSRLKQLNFLETTLGGSEGESAFRLTRAGRGFLVFRQLSATGQAPGMRDTGAKRGKQAVSL
jgi:hypothetical protein